jgi:hypothetical protein
MNIHGVLLLKRMGLPEGFIHFNNFSEIPSEFLDNLGEDRNLFIMGSDNRIKITDNPYKIKRWRRVNISKNEIESSSKELNMEMEAEGIPKENRIFSLGLCFNESNTIFQGHAFKIDDTIYIDIKRGLRKSGTDFTPDFAFTIPIINNRITFSEIPDFEFRDYVVRICKDLLLFYIGNPYLDFALMEDKKFFYHDLSIH